ncbi:hypothetical protein PoB_005210400 [Plakobranchus ocellatus]|uniref:Uncharacterized protein n=1 Tax=Plakobranchus ocellatus TaxID=259542 RepID=A0AAV4C372_9GAST|nr:hypothetical protein PoB_005210400 [Plakobranchus ocellatus]
MSGGIPSPMSVPDNVPNDERKTVHLRNGTVAPLNHAFSPMDIYCSNSKAEALILETISKYAERSSDSQETMAFEQQRTLGT